MRNAFAPRDGAILIKTPSHRQRRLRRRLGVFGGMAALALAGGLIGSLSHHDGEQLGRPHTGPFSYFPSE